MDSGDQTWRVSVRCRCLLASVKNASVFRGDAAIRPYVDGEDEVIDRHCLIEASLSGQELLDAFQQIFRDFTLCLLFGWERHRVFCAIPSCGDGAFADRGDEDAIGGVGRLIECAHSMRVFQNGTLIKGGPGNLRRWVFQKRTITLLGNA